MKLSGFSPIITTMLTDKMDIRRYVDKNNDDGTTDTVMSDSPIYTNVPCRVSFSSEDNPRDNDVDDVPVKNIPKIFCKVDADIKAGDLITVKRFDDDSNVIATYTGKLGLSSTYITHKEALFSIERSA